MAFNVNGSERMRIDSSGNVGIGLTAQSTNKLEVFGNIQVNAGYGKGFLLNDNNKITRENGGMAFTTNSAERMRINSSGQVLVNPLGVSTPSFAFTNDTNTGMTRPTSDTLQFVTGGAERIRIDGSGNVGIGVTNPASGLVVSKSTSAGRGGEISIINPATAAVGNEAALNFGLEPSTYNADNGNAQIKARINNASTAATDIMFSTWNGSAFGERARINSNGSMLIGTTATPTYPHKLLVKGNSIPNCVVAFEDEDVSAGLANGILRLSFSNDSDATNASLIYMTDVNNVIGSVTVASGTSVNYNTSSDERLKENIVDASSQLDTINNIKVREFDWKMGGHHQVGLIAQELLTVIPNVVSAGGDDESKHPYGVDYGKLTPYIIKAMQEQQAQIEILKTEIQELKDNG